MCKCREACEAIANMQVRDFEPGEHPSVTRLRLAWKKAKSAIEHDCECSNVVVLTSDEDVYQGPLHD